MNQESQISSIVKINVQQDDYINFTHSEFGLVRIEGQFENIKLTGKGKIIAIDGNFTIEDGIFEGLFDCSSCIMKFQNEKVYKGMLKNLKFHGFGELSEERNGNLYQYKGYFLNGQKHGIGTMTIQRQDGSIQKQVRLYKCDQEVKSYSNENDNEYQSYSSFLQTQFLKIKLNQLRSERLEFVQLGNIINNHSIAIFNQKFIIADNTNQLKHFSQELKLNSTTKIDCKATICVPFNDKKFIIGSNEPINSLQTLYLQNNNYQIDILFQQENKLTNVTAITCQQDNIFSGGTQGVIRIWNQYKQKSIESLQGHQNEISDICTIDDNLIASCSNSRGNGFGMIQLSDIRQRQNIFQSVSNDRRNGYLCLHYQPMLNMLIFLKEYEIGYLDMNDKRSGLIQLNKNVFGLNELNPYLLIGGKESLNCLNLFSSEQESCIISGMNEMRCITKCNDKILIGEDNGRVNKMKIYFI